MSVVVVVVALLVRLIGCGWFDACLWGLLPTLPMLLAHLPVARRRALLRFEIPALVFGVLALALVLVTGARASDAPWPSLALLRFSAFVLAWVYALRLLFYTLTRLCLRIVRRLMLAQALAGAVLLLVGIPQLFVSLQTHRIAVGQRPDAWFAERRVRTVAICTADDLALTATVLTQPADETRPVMVVCHGLGANRSMFFGYAEIAWQLGCHVVAFDFRAHGDSEGFVTTLGHREVQDVEAVVNWVRQQPAMQGVPVVLAGVSMGGATALRAAASVDADAVFAESSFADLSSMVQGRVALLGALEPLAAASLSFAAWLQHGVVVEDVSPRASLQALPLSVPVTLVHASEDRVVPLAEGKRLAAARANLELHICEGATHGGCVITHRMQVEPLVAQLLARVR